MSSFESQPEPESQPTALKVVLGAGGTGGHVFPALALGIEMRDLGIDVLWAGRESGLENQVAVENGFAFAPLAAAGFYGKGMGRKVQAAWLLCRGLLQAISLLRRVAPGGVVATGGFATAALLAATEFGGTPYFLLEQNCIPGRVTGFFSPRARETFLAFPSTKPFPGASSVTGNPLRRGVGGRVSGTREDDGKTVLFIGGSLGAQALNVAALDAAAALTNLNFIILTGRRDYEYVRSRVRSKNCELVEFTSHPEELYRRATIAVSRAGGVVLSELVAFGIPAILIPFPYATDRHQDANAAYLASVGAASVLDQSRLSGLTSLVRTLMDDVPLRRQMETAARSIAKPDAAAVIARRIAEELSLGQESSSKSEARMTNQ
jgi:UDP-N-acetylglucosamine--N-acetylmuramyl-(pentapeptide) pyrophosphoryl-undecaprenol N-acetylglucosamine transferase